MLNTVFFRRYGELVRQICTLKKQGEFWLCDGHRLIHPAVLPEARESVLFQTLRVNTEACAVPVQNFRGGPATIDKEEKVPLQRVLAELCPN